MELASTQSYANFRAWVPRNTLPVGALHTHEWVYYDWGPRSYPEPVLCLHSLVGSAESFYNQVLCLATRGYRVVSVGLPAYWTVPEFCDGLHAFLDMLGLRRVHLLAAGLGAFLGMHYAARRPERVGSLVLVHSFLGTEGLNLRIPYSAAVLRWLPDFLVRATIRAILPKGRVRVGMANAAEFAIGHTIAADRDHLASRLALCVADSSVAGRLRLPESSITLIDATDRASPAALQLAEDTAALLPNAKRAHLKEGADFPYLSVPDDVNVHVIVHLRRVAPPPVEHLTLPPPARPRPMSPSQRRPRVEATKAPDRTAKDGKAAAETGDSAAPAVRMSDEEVEAAARDVVAKDEKTRIEKYVYEVDRLREFLPECNDAHLAAVLEQCDGCLDTAISNSLDDQYDKSFYKKFTRRALRHAAAELRKKETEDVAGACAENGQEGDSTVNDVPTLLSNDAEAKERPLPQRNSDVPADHVQDTSVAGTGGTEGLAEPDTTLQGGACTMPSGTHDGNDPLAGLPVGSVAPAANEFAVGTNDAAFVDGKHPATGTGLTESSGAHSADTGASPEALAPSQPAQSGSGKNRSQKTNGGNRKRSAKARRRAAYATETDGIAVYMTSEKVGMRAHGGLVGRGPAPFRSAIAPKTQSPVLHDAWTSPDSKSVERDRRTLSLSIPSGASLFDDAGEDALNLSSPTGRYTSPSRSMRGKAPIAATPSPPAVRVVSPERTVSPTVSEVEPSGLTEVNFHDSGFMASEPELLTGDGTDGVHVDSGEGPAVAGEQYDEWDSFRTGGAAAMSSAGKPGMPVVTSGEQADSATAPESSDSLGSSDAARLREWSMSAHSASKYTSLR